MKLSVYGVFFCFFHVVLLPLDLYGSPQNIGLAPYAMLSEQWPCDLQRMSDKNAQNLHLALVWNTFGTDTSCLTTYLKDSRTKAVEIHLINEVCQRHNSCGSYEFLHEYTQKRYNKQLKRRNTDLLQKLKEYVKPLSTYLKENVPESVACYISPGLESNLSIEAAQVLIDTVKPYFSQCKIVWNPNGANPDAKPIAGTIFELHHTDFPLSSPCIANLDGEDISFPSRPALLHPFIDVADLPKIADRFANCDLNFLWIAEYNGLTAGKPLDPRERGKDQFPSAQTFALVADAKEALSK